MLTLKDSDRMEDQMEMSAEKAMHEVACFWL